MKRIGFVDFDLNNFHSNVYLKLLRGDLADRGYRVTGCWAMKTEGGQAWAQEHELPWFESVEALNEQVDAYIVLAPNNPETHVGLCEAVFPFGKTTYVDKTFAPDAATAEGIFALADRYRVRVQTSSALRYTAVQQQVQTLGGRARVRHMVAWGGGRAFDIYAIHPVEMVISSMGARVERLMRRGAGKQSQLLLDFAGGRTAVINVYVGSKTPFSAALSTADQTCFVAVEGATLFHNMASAILDLFDSNKPSIDRKETLAIMRILDASRRPEALAGFIPV